MISCRDDDASAARGDSERSGFRSDFLRARFFKVIIRLRIAG
jgi:hypothetical protein